MAHTTKGEYNMTITPLATTAQLDYNILNYYINGNAAPNAILHIANVQLRDDDLTVVNVQFYEDIDATTPVTWGQWGYYGATDGQSMTDVWNSLSNASSGFMDMNMQYIEFTDAIPIPTIITSDPTANVASSTYSNAQVVALSDSFTNANIYYTLDGSTPTSNSNIYADLLTISANTTLSAIAQSANCVVSNVVTWIYTFED
jgi:hypothetical protein